MNSVPEGGDAFFLDKQEQRTGEAAARVGGLQKIRRYSLEESMLGEIIAQTRRRRPLIHCINNHVTSNDCANILLACGGSAIMADDPEEAAEITAMCDGLVLNMGTPNPRKMEALFCAGEEANRLGHPVILDPVGAGSSAMRRDACRRLLERVRFAAIRANATEIATLVRGTAAHRGVDADLEETAPDSIDENAKRLSLQTGAAVIVTGDTDIVTDGKTVYRVHNGHSMMKTVTGSGCQLSALLPGEGVSKVGNGVADGIVGDGSAIVGGQQVFPGAVSVGVGDGLSGNVLAEDVAPGIVGVGSGFSGDRV